MCLAVPMKILKITGFNALCDARGNEHTVSLMLVQYEDLNKGDWIMVHLGRAVNKVSEEEAKLSWDLFDEMLTLEDKAR